MKQSQIDEHVDNGWIHFAAIIEVAGKPEEYVQETYDNLLKHLEDNHKFEVIKIEKNDVEKVEDSDSLYSVFADVEVLGKDINKVYDFCFEYMPGSIEIIAPQKLEFSTQQSTGFVNDFLSKLHQVDMVAKELKHKNSVLNDALGKMIQNAIFLSVAKKPKDVPSIAKETGVHESELPKFLEVLEKNNKIIKENDIYKIV